MPAYSRKSEKKQKGGHLAFATELAAQKVRSRRTPKNRAPVHMLFAQNPSQA